MLKVRTTKTGSKNTAVQIVLNIDHKTQIIKHIGSAKDDQELEDLKILGYQYINKLILDSGQLPLFKELFKKRKLSRIKN